MKKISNFKKTKGGKKMKLGLIALMSLITLLTVGTVYGLVDCTCSNPATTVGTHSSYINGSAFNISATGINSTNDKNVTAATITPSSGSITDGVWKFNVTNNQTSVNFSINTLALRDDTGYTFTISLKNQTTQIEVGTCTCPASGTLIPDNTIPVLSNNSPATLTLDTDGEVAFGIACENSSSANLFIEGQSYVMTESSDICNKTVTIPTNGLHTWYITASDGLNITTGTSYQVEIRKPGGYVFDEQGQLVDTTGATIPAEVSGLRKFINDIMSIPFKILDAIFSIFKKG